MTLPNDTDRIETIPVLPSPDLAATRAFYEDGLGFSCIWASDDYLLLRRETIEIHFWRTEDDTLCKLSSCYLRGGSIDRLHAEYDRKKVSGLSALEHKPWDMIEFHIHDPHGNLLRFGRIPDSRQD